MCSSCGVSQSPPPSSRAGAPRAIEHERAFRRWSHPAAEEIAAEDGAHASFRVYTPAELRDVPLRASSRPSGTRLPDLDDYPVRASSVRRSKLLGWLGVGMAVGFALVTAAIVVMTLKDDQGVATSRLRSIVVREHASAPQAVDLPDDRPTLIELP